MSVSLIGTLSVDFENLLNLPCYVFWKNIEGIYLGYNDYGAINLGYSSGDEIAGKNDFDMFPQEMAELYRENDRAVVVRKKQIVVPEKGLLKNKVPVIFLSYKMPLYDQFHTIVGIIGLAFTRPNNDVTCPITDSIVNVSHECNQCPQQASCFSLSEKERQCLKYLCEGLTLKLIARQMNISPKTVETHIERAKIKMNCHNKAQLILAFVKAENIK